MGLYAKWVIPRVVNCICGLKPTRMQREKIIHEAKGTVLEIGIGSGLNLPYYNSEKVNQLIGVDPYPFQKALTENLSKIDIPHEILVESAENLSMDNESIDTIVSTYTFCSIEEIHHCLQECRRVLKKDGRLIFIEHGLAPDDIVRKKQNRWNKTWRFISGGCNLNRDIPEMLELNGLQIKSIDTMYLPGWKPATWNWWGIAQTR